MNPVIRVERYSHGVRLSGYARELLPTLSAFLEGLSLKEPVRHPKGGMTMELKKRFYGLSHDRREIFIHRNSLDDLIAFLHDRGITSDRIDITDIATPCAESAVFDVFPHYVPRDYQPPIIDKLSDTYYSRRLDLQTGKGKEAPLHTKIKIPGGWSTMGEMQIGTIVTAWDGTPTAVTGVYPQGIKPIFKVTFADGRSTEVGEEHLWQIQCTGTTLFEEWSIVDTGDIRTLLTTPELSVYIPLVVSEQIPDAVLPTDPYRVGLGLAESSSRDNWQIPQDYLHASHQQRQALLHGLLYDSVDGSTYNASTQVLAEQVQYLVRSLGGSATLAQINEGYYRVSITHAGTIDKLQVISVEYTGEYPAQCISIAHPDHLYVTDDFIVTHNTFCALSAVANIKQRTLVMVQPKYFGIWIKALKETYKEIEGRYCTVSGSAELQALMERAVEGELEYDVIIMSAVTYRTYIENFERFGDKIIDMGFLCVPQRFHELIGAGVQINDEFQDDPGLVFRTDIFTNIRKQIYLSATPYTGNEYVTRMIDVMLPPDTACPLPKYDAYINVIGLMYNDPSITSKDFLTPFKGTYNHARYETRMLKSKKRMDRYFAMVKKILMGVYYKDRQPGQKALVLCATVDFIGHLTKYLNAAFPDLRVGQHVAGSDAKKLQTNDITVSTIKSAGTGQDIVDLREVILLQATDSKKDNIQILGRLRKLKNFPDVDPRMTYLVCQEIKQHLKYSKNKREHFGGKVLSHKLMRI